MFRGPLLTLLAMVVVGLVLWGADVAIQPSAQPSAASATPAAPAAGPPPAAAPSSPAAGPPSVAEPPPEPVPQDVKYVGYATTEQGPVPMAATVQSGRTKVYVCDGHKTEAWLQGSTTQSSVDASGRDGNQMTAHVSKGRLTGTMRLKGHPDWTFDVPSNADSKSGIYRRWTKSRVSGWVVQNRDQQTGLSRDASGALTPAAPLPLNGPLPSDVSMVDANTDLLAGS